ncbi:hypothetical protein [Clostridium manihotivorum]|uniref:ABC-2 family transporter protein n=1 Tax=Clostridium manihotivorum TaxID=2320868 RepID=A0A410DUL2_9CLOT|nr:hypothetical protein [Clostridium manihotivorum]QAA32903.1 hypothetical protein C1I91_15350 [Clostridium manihotivorum]
MRKFINMLKLNLCSIFSPKVIILCIAMFASMLFMTTGMYGSAFNSSSILNIIFVGPRDLAEDIGQVFMYLFYQVPILVMMGNFLYKQINEQSTYLIPKMESKKKWYLCVITTNLITNLLYYGVGVGIIVLCDKLYLLCSSSQKVIAVDIMKSIIDTYSFVSILILLVATSFLLTLIQNTLTLVFKDSNIAFITNMVLILFFIELGAHNKLDKFLPPSQGILIKHYTSNFSILWSIVYIVIFSCILLFINFRIVMKNDLLILSKGR